jgi:CRP-like cAMP-binding protein
MNQNILRYARFETISRAGSSDKGMFIIVEGKVEITLNDGNQEYKVATLHTNDFFGEGSLFNNTLRTANAIAAEETKVVKIADKKKLEEFLIKNPHFAMKMISVLSKRLVATDELLMGKISELKRIKKSLNI